MMAVGKKTGGRVKGTPNKSTAEIRRLTQRLFDQDYWLTTRARLDEGKLAPAVECRLLAYAYGEPSHLLEVPQLADIADALRRKVIHELHPGPTKTT